MFDTATSTEAFARIDSTPRDDFAELKHSVQLAFAHALETLAQFQRQPVRWEEDCLVRALGAMTAGMYSTAANDLRFFTTHVQAVPVPSMNLGFAPRNQPFSLANLKAGFDTIRAMG